MMDLVQTNVRGAERNLEAAMALDGGFGPRRHVGALVAGHRALILERIFGAGVAVIAARFAQPAEP